MSMITNAKSISINGNRVNKIAINYNPYGKTKATTLVSEKVLEDVIAKNKTPCNYVFDKQHELNLTNKNIVVDGNQDVTYGTTISNFIESDKVFFYSKTNYLTNSTANVVYMSNTIKILESGEIYTTPNIRRFDKFATLTIPEGHPNQFDISFTVLSGMNLVLEKDFFSNLIFTEDTKNTVIANHKKFIGLSDTALIEEDFKEYGSGFKLKDDVRLILNGNNLSTFEFVNNVPESYTTKVIPYDFLSTYYVSFNFKSETVEILYIDDIKFMSITDSNISMPNLKDVYYNKSLTPMHTLEFKSANLHMNQTFRNAGLGKDVPVYVWYNTLYLTSNFFDGINLDTCVVGTFGDWSVAHTKISKLVIETSDLYSSLTGTDLKNRLKTILKLKESVELELV